MKNASAQLLQKVKDGDSASFSQLIHLYEDKIFNLTQKVCSTLPSEADDVYQETFLTAFKKIHNFRESSDLGTWLYRIASNLCFMRLRKKRREPLVPMENQVEDAPSSENPIINQAILKQWLSDKESQTRKKELADAVARALARLSQEYRLVVTMKDIQGLSSESIANELDLTLAAVKSRLHRGRSLLRSYFLSQSKF